MKVESLSTYQHGIERIRTTWPIFHNKRLARLEQEHRHGVAAEKVAENILEDLFTEVLDWTLADLNNQIGYADLLLSQLGVKYLLIEAKRPGSLAWNRRAVEAALDQALRYASEQKVKCIAVSDGVMLYAADIEHGGLQDRVFVSLESNDPPLLLWWLSVHGIYRPCENKELARLEMLPGHVANSEVIISTSDEQLLHSKYKIPARCFAYVGDASNPATWKLPYRLIDGNPDVKRLPKAIQAILSNYRGAKVSSVPEKDIPDVLVRLARAAMSLGRMPYQTSDTAEIYTQLEDALKQLDRLDEVMKC